MVLIWGNLTGCKMCLDSDIFDLWRSCGECNILRAESECQLSCTYCVSGEGLDTADVPAPRANQLLTIPAAGCSVDRRDYNLECRALSQGNCGDIPSLSTSGRGCQPCPTSNFVNDCESCTVNDCLVSCASCLETHTVNNRTGGPPVSFTIPDGGCEVTNFQSRLTCFPGSEGSCPIGPIVPLPHRTVDIASWKIGVATLSVLSVLLIATLVLLLWILRTRNQRLKREMAVFMKGTGAGHQEPQRLVHASIIDPRDIRMCKRDGKDWELGAGSFGTVYKAKMGNMDVAVKTIHRQHVNPHFTAKEALQVIKGELKILEMLPFDRRVVQLYGSCTKGDNIQLVLEFMQGGDLYAAIKGIHTPPVLNWYKNGAQIALDIINGLRFLHTHNIVHRDIKSGNVLLSGDLSYAKICDVGTARIMGNTSVTSSSHNVNTTFAYAAPEILLCQKSDHRADIFSFGVVLWELITQEHPERGLLRDLQVPQECPQAVSHIVAACVSPNPRERPSAQEIIQVIESSMAADLPPF